MVESSTHAGSRNTVTGTEHITPLVLDFTALGINLGQCQACRSRGFALMCRAEALHCFLAQRFSTLLLSLLAVLWMVAVVV